MGRVAKTAKSEVQRATAGASTSTAAAGRSGGVLFVHRFGATLNAHVHLHLCMLDGVAAQDSAGRERLLRYCARPMFAAERKVWAGDGAQVRYRLPWAALQGHRADQQRPLELRLSASEFLDRIALLIPPPRKHRHHYFGVLAPNSPLRALVAAQAGRKLTAGSKPPQPKAVDADSGATRGGHPARYMWAQLLARIYGVFALKCSGCGGRVRLVGFITEPVTVRQILAHVGEPTTAPVIAPARSPPVEANAQQLIGSEAAEAIPELEFDQTANLTAEAGHDRLVADAGANAEPIPELEFDQTMGW